MTEGGMAMPPEALLEPSSSGWGGLAVDDSATIVLTVALPFIAALIVFSRLLDREYNVRDRLVHILFCLAFGLSIDLLLLAIYEIVGILSPHARWLTWRLVLSCLVGLLVLILPAVTMHYLVRGFNLKRSAAQVVAVVGELCFLALFWRAGYAFPVLTRKEMGVFTLEGFVSRLGVAGVTAASLLAGYGAVATPCSFVFSSAWPVCARRISDGEVRRRTTAVQRLDQQLRAARSKRLESRERLREEAATERQHSSRGRGRSSSSAPLSSSWLTGDVLRRQEKDEERLRELLQESRAELKELEAAQAGQRSAQKPLGFALFLLSGFWSFVNLYQIGNRFASVVLKRDPGNKDPVTRVIELLLVWALEFTPSQAASWMQPASFIFVGVLVVTSVRGFLNTSATLLRALVRRMAAEAAQDEEGMAEAALQAISRGKAVRAASFDLHTPSSAFPAAPHAVAVAHSQHTRVAGSAAAGHLFAAGARLDDDHAPTAVEPTEHAAMPFAGPSAAPTTVTRRAVPSWAARDAVLTSVLPVVGGGSTPSTPERSLSRFRSAAQNDMQGAYEGYGDAGSEGLGTASKEKGRKLVPRINAFVSKVRGALFTSEAAMTSGSRSGSPAAAMFTRDGGEAPDHAAIAVFAANSDSPPTRSDDFSGSEHAGAGISPRSPLLASALPATRSSPSSSSSALSSAAAASLTSFVVLLLAQIMGMYFLSSVLLLRMSVPEEYRRGISAAIGDIPFPFFHRWSDVIFILSAAASLVLQLVNSATRRMRLAAGNDADAYGHGQVYGDSDALHHERSLDDEYGDSDRYRAGSHDDTADGSLLGGHMLDPLGGFQQRRSKAGDSDDIEAGGAANQFAGSGWRAAGAGGAFAGANATRLRAPSSGQRSEVSLHGTAPLPAAATVGIPAATGAEASSDTLRQQLGLPPRGAADVRAHTATFSSSSAGVTRASTTAVTDSNRPNPAGAISSSFLPSSSPFSSPFSTPARAGRAHPLASSTAAVLPGFHGTGPGRPKPPI